MIFCPTKVPAGIFCDVGCVQYWPGRLSDALEMINCMKMKSGLRAQREIHHKWAARNKMSHAADFALLTCSVQLQRNKLTLCFCHLHGLCFTEKLCESKTTRIRDKTVFKTDTWFLPKASDRFFSELKHVRLSQWQCSRSYGVHCPLCSLCLLSRPGHFEVNGCGDECASFTRTLTVQDEGEGAMGSV